MSDVEIQPVRSPLRRLTGVQFVGTGSYVPERVVRNEDLAQLGYDADWILQRSGIRERRHAPPEMATSDMAAIAAERCLARAGVSSGDVDLVIVGTFTPDMPVPSTACHVQRRLRLTAAAMDVQAGCAGFMYALITGMQYVASGSSHMALVIGADLTSRMCDPNDRKTYPLFGDGAGAVLLKKGTQEQGLLAYTLGADGTGLELLWCPTGGSRAPVTHEVLDARRNFIRMEGRPVFKWAIRLLGDTIKEVVAAANLTLAEVDVFVLHQANVRILDAVAEDLGLPREKMVINLDRYGNTSGASVPLALDDAIERGLIRPGSRVLLSGFGAGLAWGTALVRW